MNRENLQRLSDHLIGGNLFQSKFDFSHYRCGTAGCAIGECGRLFNDPELEQLLQNLSDTSPLLCDLDDTPLAIRKLSKLRFDIDDTTYNYLFQPAAYFPWAWLTNLATAKEAGLLIKHFLETGTYLKRTDAELKLICDGKMKDINNDPYKA